MMDEKIKRINQLAKKSKQQPLTPEELEEQKKLRQEYVEAFKKSLTDTLEHTYIVDEHGEKHKVHRRETGK